MDLGIRGRVALVSAGSKGLGRATAEALVDEGVAVAIVARGQDGLDEAAQRIRSRGGRVFAVAADVSKADDVTRAVADSERALGPIDILVTNSGGPRSGL